MKDNVMIALLVLVLFAVLFQPQINEALTGKYTATEVYSDGDFNRDGGVNLRDYYFFEAHLDKTNPVYMERMDLNGNDEMDSGDLNMLYLMVMETEPTYEECKLNQCAEGATATQECVDGQLMDPVDCGEGICKWSTDGAYCTTGGEGEGAYRRY